MKAIHYLLVLTVLIQIQAHSQVSYNAVAAYGHRKIIPTFAGSAMQVRRSCDNATSNIGFTSCGDLDTNALKTFVLASSPLSEITGATNAVYSLRKLKCAYAGSAIRVRSTAGGSPTSDIGFTSSGDLDTTALKTFVGANSAFVTIWYDQSGNGYNATQATAANQPRIVNAGVVDKQNSRPALYFDGSTSFLQNNTYSMLLDGQTPTWNAVIVPQATNGTYAAIVSWRNASGVVNQLEVGPSNNWNTSWWSNSNYSTTNGLTVTNGSFQIITSLYTATTNQLYVNGTLSYNNTAQTNPAVISTSPAGSAATPLIIGNDNCCAGRFIKGYLFEIVLSSTNLSTTDRQFLEWSQAQYYNVSGPVLTTLPASPSSASVTIWYDQSGTAKDAAQATVLNQPRIINAGSIEKNGLVPAINFAGFPQNLVAPLSSASYPVSISLLANTSGGTSGGAFVKLGTSANAGQGGIAVGIGNSGGNFDTGGTSVIDLKEWVVWCPSNPNVNYPANPFTSTTIQQSGGAINTYLNGTNVPVTGAASAVGASIAGNLFLGGYTNGANRYPIVKESEVIVFGSALSVTRRTLLETNQSAYNAVTVSTNKYTPPTATSYHRYVNGVGRETATDSVGGTRSTVGMGFIVGQAATDFLKDNGDYITSGIDCPITATTSTSNLPVTLVQRWYNDWYVNKTDVGSNNGNITFYFDFSDYGAGGSPGAAVNYELLARSTAAGAFAIVAGTTKSVVGDRVQFVVDASNIPTNYFYTLGTKNPAASPLPVELISFTPQCISQEVLLEWSTATELRNKFFTIERTQDGEQYEKIAIVEGAGTVSGKRFYKYSDKNPLSGISYYRLRQTDMNGTEKVYPQVSVSCGALNENVTIYPNPADNSFVIDGIDATADLTIFNECGLLLFTAKGIRSDQQISTGGLPEGIYMVMIREQAGLIARKLVVVHP